jgi:hypothetical protein
MTARRILSLAFLFLALSAGAWAQFSIITPSPLPTGTVNVDYSTQLAIDMPESYFPTWSITAGNLPPGLNLDVAVGMIAGNPTTAGAYTFTVDAFDPDANLHATKQFTLYISTGLPLKINPVTPPPGAIGLFYSLSLTAAGGVPGYTWALASGTNADGLTLDANTGFLAGFPQKGGTFDIGVVMTDAMGAKVSTTLTVNVLAITSSTLPAGAVGASYFQSLTVVGATLPVSWILFGNSPLPPGLTLSSAGEISGTPTTQGTYTFGVLVTDATQNTTKANISITIGPSLTISPTTLPNGSVGVSYSQQFQATGGTSPYAWSVKGSLPAGLVLNAATGALTGTPVTPGTQTFTVIVTDAGNNTAQVTLTLTIGNFAINPAPLPNGFTGVAYSAIFTVAGNPAPLTWAVSVGPLPDGLALNSVTGALTGTPTTTGSFTFTISATYAPAGSAPVTAQQQFTVVIANGPAITVGGLPSTSPPAQQPKATVSLAGPYPLNISGTMTLAFASSVGGDDQMVRFSNGTRTASFTIPAGSTQGSFSGAANVAVLTGTVAGTITITTVLTDSAENTLPPPEPTVIVINPTPPVITRVTVTSVIGGFNVSVTGYSTPRDMISATFHFAPTTGTNLAATDVPVQLTAPFTTWYSDPASNAYGSQFTMVVPFTFTGPPGTTFPIAAVTVNLTNSKGTSNTSPPANP